MLRLIRQYSTKPTITTKNRFINFVYPDVTYSYHTTFLRDSSRSTKSIDPSGQKLFTTAEILDSNPAKFDTETEEIKIHWDDGDVSTLTKEFLEKNASVEERRKGRYFDDVSIWSSLTPKRIHTNRTSKDKTVFSSVIREVNESGLAIIQGVPANEIRSVGERIGYLKKTFYDEIFDVRTTQDATNIAYTSQFLPLHQDLLYYESPPGLQLLHYIKNAKGGESVFSDGFSGAEYVKSVDPEAYQALLTVPLNYHYENGEQRYFQSKHLIVELEEGRRHRSVYHGNVFQEVNYSPPFQAPLDFGIVGNGTTIKENGDRHLLEDFLRGYKLFEEYVNEKKITFMAEEGDVVIFDNRRILHAREEFEGERWVQGCYLDKDTFESRIRGAYI